MRIFFTLCSFTFLFLTSCTTLSTLPSSFTSENVMKLHQGMSSDEILAMFGKPQNVDVSVCGAALNEPWACTTWEYGHTSYDAASFTFSGEHDSLVLNSFNVDKRNWWEY